MCYGTSYIDSIGYQNLITKSEDEPKIREQNHKVTRDVVIASVTVSLAELPNKSSDKPTQGLSTTLVPAAIAQPKEAKSIQNSFSKDEKENQESEQKIQSVSLSLSDVSPDLTITEFNEQITFQVPGKTPVTIPRPKDEGLIKWLDQKYQKFSNLGARANVVYGEGSNTDSKVDSKNFPRGFGQELYKHYAPEKFKQIFWELVSDPNKPLKTIWIVSDNPILPWELMIPSKLEKGSKEHDFLGLEFNISRWNYGPNMVAPPKQVEMQQLTVVAPEYKGDMQLSGQKREIDELKKMPGYKLVPGKKVEMEKFFHSLPSLPIGIIHFAGHGSAKKGNSSISDYTILLEDGELDITTLRGMLPDENKNLFFFFNACEVGQAEKVSNFVNGWAPAVLEKGASGYIGTLWPIGDKGAADFSILFYQTLENKLKSGHTSIGEVLKDIRRKFLENNDPTFLAYVYYGYPNLVLLPKAPKN